MSNQTNVTYGELYLKAITPVIQVLFGRLGITPDRLSPSGVARFQAHADDVNGTLPFTYQELAPDLVGLLPADQQEKIKDQEDAVEVLRALSDLFNQGDNGPLHTLINIGIEGGLNDLTVRCLQFLATSFDDGHGLTKMITQSGWHDPSFKLDSCGGDMLFVSDKLLMRSTSHANTAFAQRLDKDLQANQPHKAAQEMVKQFRFIADGIQNREDREAIIKMAGLLLLGIANPGEATLPLSLLYRLWDILGDVPCREAGEWAARREGIKQYEQLLDEQFLSFPAGTSVDAIWRWFEAQNPRFSVGEVMNGIRHTD